MSFNLGEHKGSGPVHWPIGFSFRNDFSVGFSSFVSVFFWGSRGPDWLGKLDEWTCST